MHSLVDLDLVEKLKSSTELTFYPARPFGNAIDLTIVIRKYRYNTVSLVQIELPDDNAFGFEVLAHILYRIPNCPIPNPQLGIGSLGIGSFRKRISSANKAQLPGSC